MGSQDASFESTAQMSNDSIAPQPHQRLFVEPYARQPPARPFLQTTRRDKDVQMRIEFQIAAKGVGHHQDEGANPISDRCPLLDYSSSKNRQIMQQMAVVAKNAPEWTRHCENDASVWNFGKNGFLLLLPQKGCAIPTA